MSYCFISYSDFLNGNVINWSNAEWEVSGMVSYNEDNKKICGPLQLGVVLVPELKTIYDSRQICNNLGGKINVISNKKNNDEVIELMKTSQVCLKGGGIWTGWWDEISEGNWTSIPYSKPLNIESFDPWQPGEPNGNTIENCAAITTGSISEWADSDCNRKFCVTCLIQTLPVFILRGVLFDK